MQVYLLILFMYLFILKHVLCKFSNSRSEAGIESLLETKMEVLEKPEMVEIHVLVSSS